MRLINSLKWRLRREQNRAVIRRVKKNLYTNNFTIISQNCIGGVFYHDMGMEFLSPTINAFIKEPDFVRMVLNLKYYMEQPLDIYWGEEYPIGRLDDVEIHFMHYDTCKDAKSAWERRVKRINYDRIVVLATDRNGFDDNVYEDWKRIPYPKVLFTANPEYAGERGSVYYPEYQADGCVPDLIPDRAFYKDGILISVINQT